MSPNTRLAAGRRRPFRIGTLLLSAACAAHAGAVAAQDYPYPYPLTPMPPGMPDVPPPAPPVVPSVPPAVPGAFVMTPLVSNGAVPATTIDSALINPWGLTASPESPIWVANNATQTTTAYDGAGNTTITVALPAGTRGPADATGLVFNATADFIVDNGIAAAPATFILDGESGTLLAWAPEVDPANALIVYDDGAGGAVYTGLAIAATESANLLYAADFANGKVDVFDAGFRKVVVPNAFVDPLLPPGYAPFGIQALTIEGTTVILVAYAQRNPDVPGEELQGEGLGAVSVFDTNGTLLRQLVPQGPPLNAPWAAVVAPPTFGALANLLLIGNFGDGVINAFDPVTGAFVDALRDAAGQPIAIDGLWGLMFGNDTNGQSATSLYFAAGIGEEAAGLYGRIDASQ